jgi:leucine dehydrogenase
VEEEDPYMQDTTHEEIVVLNDEKSGLHAIIAIHNTRLGPARGGLRIKSYAFPMDAMDDALSLSYHMTLKFAFYGLPYGGAKAIIIHDESKEPEKRRQRLRAFARSLARYRDRYATGPDLGSNCQDLNILKRKAPNVVGDSEETISLICEGTAVGVIAALEGVSSESLEGQRATIIGAGKVGSHVAQLLRSRKVELVIADIDEDKARALADLCQGQSIAADQALQTPTDILVPCAAGPSITLENVDSLNCRFICGAENAQLAQTKLVKRLYDKAIVWVPDFVAGAGGAMIAVGMTSGPKEEQLQAIRESILKATRSLALDAKSAQISLHKQALEITTAQLNNAATRC